VAQPIPLGGDRLLVSAGYAVGSHLLQIRRSAEGWQVETLWQSPRLKLKFTQAVFHQGFLYGLDDGVLVCLDPETGERRWKKGRYGHGQILLVEDLLLVQTEDGELVLIDPQPEGLEELARLPVLSGRAWNSLAMAGPYLLLRNHQEAVCLELPGEAVAVASSPAGLP
jgi:outer membrane protein assembly factor BamB